MSERPFRVLGVQQVAVGSLDRAGMHRFWVELLGFSPDGVYRSDAENVDEEITSVGVGVGRVEVDLMQPVDPSKSPKVHDPALNHFGLWIDDLRSAVEWLGARGVRFTPGGIRRGASGHEVCFVHPKGNDAAPIGAGGVLLELVQAPESLVSAVDAHAADESIDALARKVLDGCRARGWKLVTAESLTGGRIAGALTEIAGASDVVDRGYVVYSWEAKGQMLGVSRALLESQGAVCEAVARAMAEGALAHSHPCAELSIAVTGIAGPGPGEGKPAGRVHIASARKGVGEVRHLQRDYGSVGRAAVRRATVLDALTLVSDWLGE